MTSCTCTPVRNGWHAVTCHMYEMAPDFVDVAEGLTVAIRNHHPVSWSPATMSIEEVRDRVARYLSASILRTAALARANMAINSK